MSEFFTFLRFAHGLLAVLVAMCARSWTEIVFAILLTAMAIWGVDGMERLWKWSKKL